MTTGLPQLGTLEYVDVRSIWTREALDFTPWLLANAQYLGEALGMDLELESAEHAVGDFSLDLIGRDLSSGQRVIVENQLEQTDHGHLGQLLTYAGGVDEVGNIVWVAPRFRSEHRAALDWLNVRTQEGTNFFGVEITVVKIGQSAPAPLFRVVAQPNGWVKAVKTSSQAGQSARADLYRQYWTQFLERLRTKHPDWFRGTPPPYNYVDMSARGAGLYWGVSFTNAPGIRSQLYSYNPDGEANERMYARLVARKSEFEEAFGGSLVWDPLEGRRSFRIEVPQMSPATVEETDRWPAFLDWMIETQERLRSALQSLGGIQWLTSNG